MNLPASAFLQYGAIGLLALIAVLAVFKLWSRHEKAYEQEVARGDRLEAELLALNKLMSEQLAEFVRASEAIRDVVELVRSSRRRW